MPGRSKRIAVIKPCCIGDCVMALPVLQSLASYFGGAAIDVFVGEHSRPVFEGRTDVTALRPVADIPGWRDLPGLAGSLRAGRYELLIVLDRSRYVRLAARLSRAREIGFLERGPDNTRHEIDLCLDVLKGIGVEPATTMPEICIPRAAAFRAAEFTASLGGPYVVLHPGGAQNPGALMPSKRWPLDRWSELVAWARGQGFQVVLTGSPAERRVCERLREASGADGVWIAAGELNLIESAAVIERACLFAGPDTGLSHIAAATGSPTIAIFGPTNPVRYAPRGPRARVLAPPESFSLPSVDLRAVQSSRPGVSTARVSAADVIAACRELLDAGSGER